MTEYKHVISLGWFCSVAQELEKLGLRGASYPFDWILSDWETVYEITEGKCKDFLDGSLLVQDEKFKNIYNHKNRKCLTYIHNINPYLDYKQEIEKTKKKYEHRLERFLHDIQEPCIFLRYIRNEEEFQFVSGNREKIEEWLRRYHPDNQIVFIAEESLGHVAGIWSVKKDAKDSVAREFMSQLPELEQWFLEQKYSFSIEKNQKLYKKKQRKKKLLKYPKRLKNRWYWLCWILRGRR